MMEPQQIENRLKKALDSEEVLVEDMTGTKDHFKVTVVSSAFQGKTLVEQHQMVYAPFREEIGGPIHAFSIKTFTPEKWEQHQETKIQ